MIKRIICLILADILIMSCSVGFVTAGETSLIGGADNNKEIIRQSALDQITEYLESDSQTKGKAIDLSDEFIDLYDIDGAVSGYMIPLMNMGKEIGYISASVLDTKCIVQDIYVEDNALEKFKEKVSRAKGKQDHNIENSRLLFVPPMDYIIEADGLNGNKEYLTLNGDSITQNVEENRDMLKKFNDEIRSKLQQTGSVRVAVAVEDVRLVREASGQFVPVTPVPPPDPSYGGNQMWWPDNSDKENRGCGPVSAANITQYLASKNSTKYGKLYPYTSTSYTNFMQHMDAMYTLINPGWLGEPSLSDYKSKVLSYASSKGVALTGVTKDNSGDRDVYATFVKAGLNLDTPVACLNMQLSGYEYGPHWMTISKYFRDSVDNRWIAVSTWGERRSVNFDTWQYSTSQYGGGMEYFK